MSNARWHDVCALDELVEGAGVAALVGGRQIALFQVHGRVYALDNFDPASRANVLFVEERGQIRPATPEEKAAEVAA